MLEGENQGQGDSGHSAEAAAAATESTDQVTAGVDIEGGGDEDLCPAMALASACIVLCGNDGVGTHALFDALELQLLHGARPADGHEADMVLAERNGPDPALLSAYCRAPARFAFAEHLQRATTAAGAVSRVRAMQRVHARTTSAIDVQMRPHAVRLRTPPCGLVLQSPLCALAAAMRSYNLGFVDERDLTVFMEVLRSLQQPAQQNVADSAAGDSQDTEILLYLEADPFVCQQRLLEAQAAEAAEAPVTTGTPSVPTLPELCALDDFLFELVVRECASSRQVLVLPWESDAPVGAKEVLERVACVLREARSKPVSSLPLVRFVEGAPPPQAWVPSAPQMATTDSVALEWPNEHKEVLYDRPEAVAAALSLLPPLRPLERQFARSRSGERSVRQKREPAAGPAEVWMSALLWATKSNIFKRVCMRHLMRRDRIVLFAEAGSEAGAAVSAWLGAAQKPAATAAAAVAEPDPEGARLGAGTGCDV